MVISEHLTLAELIRSESAKRNGISNMPTPEHIANLKELAENIFEPIRANFRTPILISSGYRSKELNAKIGGANTSQHSLGQAIDIDMDGTNYGVTNAEIFHFIKDKLPFDQLIWEFGNETNPDWVHCSYSERHRKEVLIAYKTNGSTHYKKYYATNKTQKAFL
jgi:zinc D-Ala-D-Ala carboxypeptidase